MIIINITFPNVMEPPMLSGPPHDDIQSATHLQDESSRGQPRAAAGQDELDSARLLQGRREVLIRHGGECYRLRHTRNDKLILTK